MKSRSFQGLKIEYISTAALKPDPANPRRHSKAQILQIAHCMEQFGCVVPLGANDDNTLIFGHGRLLAALRLGLQEVPIIRLSHLSPSEISAFRIADNKLTENATWDERLLGEVFRDLSISDIDFNLEITGFSVSEIDLFIEGVSTTTTASADDVSALSEFLNLQPVTKVGDLWLARHHRILCGDALLEGSFRTLMNGKRAHASFSDPPYNVEVQGHARGNGRSHYREFLMASGEMDDAQYTAFLRQDCSLIALNSVPGSIHFICADWRHIAHLLAAAKTSFTSCENLCVWAKPNAGLGSFYRSQHELVAVFKHGKVPHRNNVQLGKHGRYRSNVWQYPGGSNFGRLSEDGAFSAQHPTPKPVNMIADAVLDCTARGEIILDSFLGSGSTLIATERVGRVCYALEIDPLYVDLSIRRWQRHTGESAVHAASGKTFNECAASSENAS